MPEALESAQATLARLLEAERVRRVVCVDDYYARDQTLDGLIQRVKALPTEVLTECLPEAVIAPARLGGGIDLDVVETHLTAWWEASGAQIREEVLIAVEERSTDEEEASEAVVMKTLHKMIGATPLITRSMAQWRAQRDQLLNDTAKTLLLFDKIFSREGINSAQTAMEAIRDALDASRPNRLLCGLLTTTTAIADEYAEWQQLKDQYNLDSERVIVISKSRLSDDPLGFPRAVKMTILAPRRRQMRSRVGSALRSAHQAALKKVDEMTPYDFEHVVFRRSADEGVWEPDTLFRIYGIYARREALAKARTDTALEKVVVASRKLADLATLSATREEITSWRLQHDEMYEDAEQLRRYHLPIDLGDLFETAAGKQFILLAQPCDVMLRKSGARAGYVTSFWVAELRSEQPTQRNGVYELPYYDSADGSSRWVSFSRRCSVSPSVLDLCVYQPDGESKFVVDEACSSDVIEPLRKRHVELTREFKRYLDLTSLVESRFAGVKPEDTSRVKALILRVADSTSLLKADVQLPGTISFGFRRVGRLCAPWSVALLGDFAQFIARAAFEMDLGDLGV